MLFVSLRVDVLVPLECCGVCLLKEELFMLYNKPGVDDTHAHRAFRTLKGGNP